MAAWEKIKDDCSTPKALTPFCAGLNNFKQEFRTWAEHHMWGAQGRVRVNLESGDQDGLKYTKEKKGDQEH